MLLSPLYPSVHSLTIPLSLSTHISSPLSSLIMFRALVIPVSGEVKEVKLPNTDDKLLKKIADIVGGDSELAPCSLFPMHDNCSLYGNEDKNNLFPNPHLLKLFPAHPLYGTLVILCNDDRGKPVSLPSKYTVVTWMDCFKVKVSSFVIPTVEKDIPPRPPAVLPTVERDIPPNPYLSE